VLLILESMVVIEGPGLTLWVDVGVGIEVVAYA